MKYCSKCGKEIMDEAVVCTNCGCAQGGVTANDDSKSAGWAFLGFCIPIVGLILYLIWKKDYPLKASSCGKGALISVIIPIAIWVVYLIIIGVVSFIRIVFYSI